MCCAVFLCMCASACARAHVWSGTFSRQPHAACILIFHGSEPTFRPYPVKANCKQNCVNLSLGGKSTLRSSAKKDTSKKNPKTKQREDICLSLHACVCVGPCVCVCVKGGGGQEQCEFVCFCASVKPISRDDWRACVLCGRICISMFTLCSVITLELLRESMSAAQSTTSTADNQHQLANCREAANVWHTVWCLLYRHEWLESSSFNRMSRFHP